MAIKIIKENPVPRREIACESCGSILEYGNADLMVAQRYLSGTPTAYKIQCPVCGVYIECKWIEKRVKE